jgi:hypothetical protein
MALRGDRPTQRDDAWRRHGRGTADHRLHRECPQHARQDIADNDCVVLCRPVAGPNPTGGGVADGVEYLTFETTEIVKGADVLARRMGTKAPYRFSTWRHKQPPGVSTYLAFGLKDDEKLFQLGSAIPVNEREIDYVRRLQKFPAKGTERLVALLPDLGTVDELIAVDVQQEIENLSFAEIRAAAARLPIAKVRACLNDPKATKQARRNALRMLCACGSKDDLPLLRTLIESREKDASAWRDLAVGCYLHHGGEEALAWIEQKYLRAVNDDYRGAYGAILGFRFVLAEVGGIPADRAVKTFRLLLDQPKLADLIVPDLTRLQDWDSTPRLVKLFRDATTTETLYIRVPILLFLRRSPRDDAKTYLAELTKLDPYAARRAAVIDDVPKRP